MFMHQKKTFSLSTVNIKGIDWDAGNVVIALQHHINYLTPFLEATQDVKARESAEKIKIALGNSLSAFSSSQKQRTVDYSAIDEDLTRLRAIYVQQKERCYNVAKALSELEGRDENITFAAEALVANITTFDFHLEFVNGLQSHIRQYFGRGRSL